MFRYLNDVDEDPFMMDPFAAHRQHMRSMFDPFGMDPFALAVPQMQMRPAGPLAPFGMMGMYYFFHLQERMTGSPNCQTFSSSTVISYSATDNGAPQVYQQTSETRTGPGGIRETRQSMRDSESGLERLAIGHHIGERAHIMERSRNRRTGDREERQDFINLDESESFYSRFKSALLNGCAGKSQSLSLAPTTMPRSKSLKSPFFPILTFSLEFRRLS
uniref:Uncharacterized protein n=1 Tax=Periophthalmus magnuspinnatus TaxID=409849 RepID=A0A3B3ZUG5_9GOBI